jgi:hypothetical protein
LCLKAKPLSKRFLLNEAVQPTGELAKEGQRPDSLAELPLADQGAAAGGDATTALLNQPRKSRLSLRSRDSARTGVRTPARGARTRAA